MRSLILWLKKLLGMANTVKVQGSKTVARARKGDTGNGGITYRITVWEDGKEYRNDSSLKTDGERIIDIAVNKAMSLIGDTTFKAYKCRVTHTSDASTRPLTTGTYWEAINTLQPIVTPVLLADTIAANFIDVDNLYVKHLNAADGTFTGGIRIPFVPLSDAGLNYLYRESTSKPGTGGDFYWYHYALKDGCASYIDLSEHVVYYNQCVVLHVPNLASLDGRKFAFTFPYRPLGYDLGGAFVIQVPDGGAIHSDAIQLENRLDMSFVKRTSRAIANGGVVEILIQIKDNNPIVYITSGDVPDLYNKDYAPWSQ